MLISDDIFGCLRGVLSAAVCFAWAAVCPVHGDEIVGVVTRVSDGDTIWVTPKGGEREKVRLDRIDAPESDQAYGKAATKRLKELVGGKMVRVVYGKRDRYKRVLGIVHLGEDDINLQMVREGCAWHYSYFDKTKAYADAQVEARAAKRGLWAAHDPVNPYEWRKMKRAKRRRR